MPFLWSANDLTVVIEMMHKGKYKEVLYHLHCLRQWLENIEDY